MNKYHSWSKSEAEFVIKNYPNMGTVGCSEILNLPRNCILTYACRNGIKVKHSVFGRGAKFCNEIKRNKRDLDASRLTITTPEQSYTLGYLWGDGNLYKASPKYGRYYAKIEINAKDYSNVRKFFRCFGKWSEKLRQRDRGKPLICATLFDGVFGVFLKSNNYDQKSFLSPTKILTIIPGRLHKYFWRGFIDADGCFGWHKRKNKIKKGYYKSGYFHITGSHGQEWSDFEKLLQRLNIKYTLERKSSYSGKISRIIIYRKEGIASLGKFIYGGKSNISLKRKYKKFLDIINYQKILAPNIRNDV